MSTAVRTASTYRIRQDTELNQKIEDLKGDLRNLTSHVFGEHEQCLEIAYYKCNHSQQEQNHIPAMKLCGLYTDVNCVQRLITHAESIIANKTSNIVETFNSIICKFFWW